MAVSPVRAFINTKLITLVGPQFIQDKKDVPELQSLHRGLCSSNTQFFRRNNSLGLSHVFRCINTNLLMVTGMNATSRSVHVCYNEDIKI